MPKVLEKRKAFTALVGQGGYFLGLAVEGEAGYYPQMNLGLFGSYDEAKKEAARRNEQFLDLTPAEAWKIVASSMAAQPRDFDPTVPQPGSTCLVCHGSGLSCGGRGVPVEEECGRCVDCQACEGSGVRS